MGSVGIVLSLLGLGRRVDGDAEEGERLRPVLARRTRRGLRAGRLVVGVAVKGEA